VIEADHLPVLECEKPADAVHASAAGGPVRTLDQAVAEAEKFAIIRALHEADGNRQNAAKLLNTALRNLYYKIKKYQIPHN
jgi:transcriptional regulator with PAS, ATPase and Fis domain